MGAAQEQVFSAVGQHPEALLDQGGCHFHQLQRIGLQGVVVADEFELDPVGLKDFARHLCCGDGLLRTVAASGVGQDRYAAVPEQLPKALARIGRSRRLPTQRGGDHGRLGDTHGLLQHGR
jgi:hypothetical protein